MTKYSRYLELAQQAKTAGDEVAAQHHLQHAEHWYRTAMADRSGADSPPAPACLSATTRRFGKIGRVDLSLLETYRAFQHEAE
jgi:hypothetical protein